MSIANTDEQMRHELLARDMFLSDLATDLDAAEKKGREEGREEGKIDPLRAYFSTFSAPNDRYHRFVRPLSTDFTCSLCGSAV
jgi:hypothetical protein